MSASTAAPTSAARADVPKTAVFVSGAGGYHTYRIPAIVRAANGDLLAFAEGRKTGGGDAGDIDLLLKRSADLGRTWSNAALVQDEWSDPDAPVTIGNPAPVVDALDPQHPGRIWLPFTRNNDRVLVTYSDDHGATWSAPRDVTPTAKRPTWSWYATGPGHGIQLTRGPHTGRLVIASDHRLADADAWGAHVLLSDDHGATWTVGAVDTHDAASPIHPNENAAVELVDGRVYFNARDQHGADPATRAVAFSNDGGATYVAPFAADASFTSPVVQNALLRVSANDQAATEQGDARKLLAWSGPIDPKSRRDLAIRTSADEAETWSPPTIIHPGPAAYSDLVTLDNARLGILYEAGDPLYREIVFASITLED